MVLYVVVTLLEFAKVIIIPKEWINDFDDQECIVGGAKQYVDRIIYCPLTYFNRCDGVYGIAPDFDDVENCYKAKIWRGFGKFHYMFKYIRFTNICNLNSITFSENFQDTKKYAAKKRLIVPIFYGYVPRCNKKAPTQLVVKAANMPQEPFQGATAAPACDLVPLLQNETQSNTADEVPPETASELIVEPTGDNTPSNLVPLLQNEKQSNMADEVLPENASELVVEPTGDNVLSNEVANELASTLRYANRACHQILMETTLINWIIMFQTWSSFEMMKIFHMIQISWMIFNFY